MKYNRIISAILSAVLVLAFVSCSSGKSSTSDEYKNETVTDSGASDFTADLSRERYDGYNYRIQVRKGSSFTQYFDEPQEDVVNDAIYRRNKEVEARFGITISCVEGEGNNTDISALNSILAGDDAYDIIFTHSRSAFVYALQGAAINIHDIPEIHLEKPWWSADISDSCTVNGKLYVLDGDISVNSLQNTMCMFFNKRIFDELGYDYPYDAIKDGDWTFDDFAYYAKKSGADLNGDGVITPEADRFGFVTAEWGAPINILYAGGGKIFDKDDDGELYLSLYTNKTVEIFDSFFGLMDSKSCYMQMLNPAGGYYNPNIFHEGRAMFYADSLGVAKNMRAMDDDFGIIPYPKFDEDDPYSTAINGYAPFAIIPITVSDTSRTGAITEALAAYGSEYVIPAFYETALKSKYARDEQSEEMIDIIKTSIIFDLGYLCGSTYESCGRDLANLSDKNFSSWYTARESQARTNLENFVKNYGGE